jgi:DNA-binding transcriptional MerR regulator
MPYSPSEAVEKSGFSIDTLRYYERVGLLRGVARTAGGQRAFSDQDIAWLDLLRCLRDTGMPINQMQRYTELSQDDGTVAERLALLEEHARQVEETMRTLKSQQKHLREKIEWYRSL